MRRIDGRSHQKIFVSLLSGKAAWVAGVMLIGVGVVHKLPTKAKATAALAAQSKPLGKPAATPTRGPFQIISDALGG